MPYDDEDEDTTDTTPTILRAGVTENKLNVKSDHLGQLLGGMDKIARIIAFTYLTSTKLPIEGHLDY